MHVKIVCAGDCNAQNHAGPSICSKVQPCQHDGGTFTTNRNAATGKRIRVIGGIASLLAYSASADSLTLYGPVHCSFFISQFAAKGCWQIGKNSIARMKFI